MRDLRTIHDELVAAEKVASDLRAEWLSARHSVPGAPQSDALAREHATALADQWRRHYGALTRLTALYHEKLSRLGC